jgi:hypothetical protein
VPHLLPLVTLGEAFGELWPILTAMGGTPIAVTGWAKTNVLFVVALRGRVFAQSSAF